jgi:hypothetical protein
MAFEKASIMKRLPPSSITHTSSRMLWSFRIFSRATSACRGHPTWCRNYWSGCIIVTERLCHTSGGVGSGRCALDTGSCVCKLRIVPASGIVSPDPSVSCVVALRFARYTPEGCGQWVSLIPELERTIPRRGASTREKLRQPSSSRMLHDPSWHPASHILGYSPHRYVPVERPRHRFQTDLSGRSRFRSCHSASYFHEHLTLLRQLISSGFRSHVGVAWKWLPYSVPIFPGDGDALGRRGHCISHFLCLCIPDSVSTSLSASPSRACLGAEVGPSVPSRARAETQRRCSGPVNVETNDYWNHIYDTDANDSSIDL